MFPTRASQVSKRRHDRLTPQRREALSHPRLVHCALPGPYGTGRGKATGEAEGLRGVMGAGGTFAPHGEYLASWKKDARPTSKSVGRNRLDSLSFPANNEASSLLVRHFPERLLAEKLLRPQNLRNGGDFVHDGSPPPSVLDVKRRIHAKAKLDASGPNDEGPHPASRRLCTCPPPAALPMPAAGAALFRPPLGLLLSLPRVPPTLSHVLLVGEFHRQ